MKKSTAKTVSAQAADLFRQDNYPEVISLYQKALQSHPSDATTWGNLGIALRHMNQHAAAAGCLKRALELDPKSPAILRHYAVSLIYLNRKEEALQAFAEALRLQPEDYLTHAHYAFALREFDMHDEALEHFTIARRLNPESKETKWDVSKAYLALGNYKEGWKDFEVRWELDKAGSLSRLAEEEKSYQSRRWQGEDLRDKTVLIYAEQGFGDTILCSRYIPLIKALGARVILSEKPHLHRLFHTIPGLDRLVQDVPQDERVDYHVPIMSLPALFGTETSTIPPAPPLYIPKDLPDEITRGLAPHQDCFRVGIVWSGSPTFGSNYKRATSFERFLRLAEIPGVQLYSLQKGPAEQELTDCNAEGLVVELGPHLRDFADTAAVLKKLDLVIMTDSSVAHLAGSIGCPIWNLLSTGAYWLYMAEREDSPWYPSMRLFRQPEPGDWDSVFEKVTAELTKAIALKKSQKWSWPLERQQPVPKPRRLDTAITLHKQGKDAEAIQLYKRILRNEPENVTAWRNLGAALRKTGNPETSVACLQKALELQPGSPDTLTNLGNSLTDLDRPEPALAAHASAVAMQPENILIRKNYATCLRQAGHLKEALLQFEKILELQPDDDKARWEHAAICLHLGLYKGGWEGLEARWKLGLKERSYAVPRWRGEDLTGKTILVYKEQGFGDTLLCSRYLPLIKARGGRILFECQKQLHRLFEAFPDIDRLAEPGSIDEHFDYHVPMLSLPWIFDTDSASIPSPLPLAVPVALPAEAKRLLDLGHGRFKVGIVWSGSVTFLENSKRAVTAASFLPLSRIPGVQLYSLQKGPREHDLSTCGGEGPIIHLGAHLQDFADTAAVIKELDLVIMTDSAVAHLTGSLGRPVWNLLNFAPYWLYRMQGETCPWYSSMRLFRQPVPGDWDSVFRNVAAELEQAACQYVTQRQKIKNV